MIQKLRTKKVKKLNNDQANNDTVEITQLTDL